jgi:hypothetical protein
MYSKPSLISNSVLKSIDKLFANNIDTSPSIFTYFYESYIEPYSFALCSFFILFVYLYMRYYIKKELDGKEQKRDD